jgi:superfamily II DNA/RNA helicase
LAFQLPALIWAFEAGLTVVIVPTVALARDQEDRFRALLSKHPEGRAWSGQPLAYHSGLDEEAKRNMRGAIRSGSIPIVFASPEAVLGRLKDSLFEAARQGRLRIFAVDEAHIISQWGQQFRPEFQEIAGLRDALLAECPRDSRFRTLLMSATITAECYETCRTLFGRGGIQMVSEVALRPEPGFLICSATDEAEQKRKVFEALLNLPRPLILYTTLREHAESWDVYLRKAGFRRLRLVRGGDLSEESGDTVLSEWHNRKVDIIVATSAFGLGVDQAEVRSVVHACLPESVDRYYQEVGRAGRDGKAAVALLVSTPQDQRIAEGLATERLISVERGFERWEAMWHRKSSRGHGIYLVSLDNRPADISESSIQNAAWNSRTLVLMARAGLIEFSAHPLPEIVRTPDEDETAFEERRRKLLEQFSREKAIVIHSERHLQRAYWDEVMAQTRAELLAEDRQSLDLVRELRNLKRPLNDIFRDVYTLLEPPVRPPRLTGSCPVTRRAGTVSFRFLQPEVSNLTITAAELSDKLKRAIGPFCDPAGRLWITYDVATDERQKRRWKKSVIYLLNYLISNGVVEVSIRDGVLREEDWHQLGLRASLGFLIRTPPEAPISDPLVAELLVPRITIMDDREADNQRLEQIMRVQRPHHVIVVPRTAQHPTRPGRKVLELVPFFTIEELLNRLDS